jgi:hypothetical protein
MGRRFAIKKFGWIALVSVLLVCAVYTPGESWTRRGLDGQWQDFGGGWWYCWYSSSDTAYWKYGQSNPTSRFKYSYAGTGQWYNSDLSSNWYTLGAAGAGETFVGDGAWHNVNSNNWNYLYSAAGDYGRWYRNGLERFLYNYTSGQWSDHAAGNSSYWSTVGGAGVSSAFIGDGAWHNVNSNNWNYLYSAAGDYGRWYRNGLERFLYNYTSGQWSDHAAGNSPYWSTVGGAGVSSAFIGDGTWHNVNSDSWNYLYSAAGDYGTWNRNGLHRFFYNYNSGQWSDHAASNSSYWSTVGGAGASSAFIGDGAWHNVNSNNWCYLYSATGDYGTWHRNGLHRFVYYYSSGQWSDHAASNSSYWSAVGGAGVSSAFIGDGSWHGLGTNWSYYYDKSSDSSQFKYQGNLQFAYDYGIGQWSHYDRMFSVWRPLSDTGRYSVFIGDGQMHEVGGTWPWQYWFDPGDGCGYWTTSYYFKYDYSLGQWYTLSPWYFPLGGPGLSAVFMGDGAQHDLHNGWLFAMDGWWAGNFYRSSGALRYSVTNDTGESSIYDGPNSQTFLGSSIGIDWLWDGQKHSGGNNTFKYDYAADELLFYTAAGSFLKYGWAESRWYDCQAGTGAWILVPMAWGSSTPQIKKHYWWGDSIMLTSIKSMNIIGRNGNPLEEIQPDTSRKEWWIYHYDTGWWDYKWIDSTLHEHWQYNMAQGAPDLYR